jgi:aldehyde:ferredoxin oxidoreductase
MEGRADDWTYLLITDDADSKGVRVTFGDARPWQCLTTGQTLQALKKAVGDNRAGALSIGPAAERLIRLSYINVDTRAIGRGGPGAVLGSGSIPEANPGRVKEIRQAAIRELRETRANHTKYGTPQYIEIINLNHSFSAAGYRVGIFVWV